MNGTKKPAFSKKQGLVSKILSVAGTIIFSLIFVAFIVVLIYTLAINNDKMLAIIDNKITLSLSIALLMVLSASVIVLDLLSPGNTSFGKNESASNVANEISGQVKVTLEKEKNGRKGTGVPRFYKLSETDRQVSENNGALTAEATPYVSDITLEALCEQFRNFAANKLHLYYDISTVRCFISGLAVTHLVIMQGISGTGKTSLACAFGEFIGNSSVVVPVQPSWKERTDLLGYFNEFTKNYNETLLLQKIYEAGYSNDIYITVLDEMNIARVEYYFAEFLSLLEMKDPKNWLIDIVSDTWQDDPVRLKNGRLQLPENMWYIGTANNDDSTLAISDKVYDRAMILDLDSRARPFEAPETEPVHLSAQTYNELRIQAQRRLKLTRRSRRKIDALDAYMIENLGISFGNRIMKQIEEFVPVYVACGGTEEEAIDYLLAKKVLRKLEAKNPLFVKRVVPAFLLYTDELFGDHALPVCRRFLAKFDL